MENFLSIDFFFSKKKHFQKIILGILLECHFGSKLFAKVINRKKQLSIVGKRYIDFLGALAYEN